MATTTTTAHPRHVSDPPGVTTQTPDAVDDPAGAIKALECIFRNDVPNLPGVTPEELNAMGECQGLGVLFDALLRTLHAIVDPSPKARGQPAGHVPIRGAESDQEAD